MTVNKLAIMYNIYSCKQSFRDCTLIYYSVLPPSPNLTHLSLKVDMSDAQGLCQKHSLIFLFSL